MREETFLSQNTDPFKPFYVTPLPVNIFMSLPLLFLQFLPILKWSKLWLFHSLQDPPGS